MARGRSESIRTCIGCRRRDAPARLVRLVAQDGRLVLDVDARLPGRGAWLHPSCVELARRRRSITRALRVADVRLDELTDVLARWQADDPARYSG